MSEEVFKEFYSGLHPNCPQCDSPLNTLGIKYNVAYVFCSRQNREDCDYGQKSELTPEAHEEEYLELRIQAKREEKQQRQEEYRVYMDETKAEIKKLIRQKKALELGEPEVSDHAALRYLERFRSLDVKALKDEILTDEVRGLIKENPSGQHEVRFEGKKYRIRLDGNVLITIIPGWERKK